MDKETKKIRDEKIQWMKEKLEDCVENYGRRNGYREGFNASHKLMKEEEGKKLAALTSQITRLRMHLRIAKEALEHYAVPTEKGLVAREALRSIDG